MTFEELAAKVGVLSPADLQELLSRLGLTASDCVGGDGRATTEFHSILEQTRNMPTNWHEYDKLGPIK